MTQAPTPEPELTEEWVTDTIKNNTGGVGEIYPEPAIELIVNRHKEIVAGLKAELAESIPKAKVQEVLNEMGCPSCRLRELLSKSKEKL